MSSLASPDRFVRMVYAQARKPGVDRVTFIRRWREHGSLALMDEAYFGDVRRYVQSDVVDAQAFEWPSVAYDAVGEICFATAEDLARSNAAESRERTIRPHALALFGAEAPVNIICRDVGHWAKFEPSFKIYRFLKFADATDRSALETAMIERLDSAERASADARPQIVSCRQSIAVETGTTFDVLEEIGLMAFAGNALSNLDATYDSAAGGVGPALRRLVIMARPLVLFDSGHIASFRRQ